jgi:hypothetical protein
MEKLQLLGIALGLASLAGVNLYLTVFVTGLAVQQHWIVLSGPYQSLEVLGHPAVVIIAGVLYFLEFFADKIPWVDSIWDAVHTAIRPIGGAFLALKVMGQTDPVLDVVVALLAGSVSLLTHTTKAGTRLAANTSPEPFSNVALSVAEDALVLGGLALIHFNPLLALGVVVLVLACIIAFAPRVVRALRVKLRLIGRKLNAPPRGTDEPTLTTVLPRDMEEAFARLNPLGETIAWAAPCISGPSKVIRPNLFGWIVATNEEPHQLHFVARRGWRHYAHSMELAGRTVTRESRFLSENVVINGESKRDRLTFLFERSQAKLADEVAASLRERLGRAPVVETPGDEERVEEETLKPETLRPETLKS